MSCFCRVLANYDDIIKPLMKLAISISLDASISCITLVLHAIVVVLYPPLILIR